MATAALALLACAGCVGRQHALDPAGRGAERLAGLWWLNLGVTGLVYLLVLAAVAIAVARHRGADPAEGAVVEQKPSLERRTRAIAAGSLVLAAVLLVVLGIADGGARDTLNDAERPLVVAVTGHQWWWEFEYDDSIPANRVNSPNALHLPAGVDVRLDLASHDVVHSLWIPNLSGKRDLVPGHPTSMMMRAERPGTYFGQCAEFCGHQHATMRFVVIVEPVDRFRRWLETQRAPAAVPAQASLEQRGRDLFLGSTCVMCHSIQGTGAMSRAGPDLSHVGSRPTVAAATLPTVQQHMARWIREPQQIRPGVRMPPNALAPQDLAALSAYLVSLK